MGIGSLAALTDFKWCERSAFGPYQRRVAEDREHNFKHHIPFLLITHGVK